MSVDNTKSQELGDANCDENHQKTRAEKTSTSFPVRQVKHCCCLTNISNNEGNLDAAVKCLTDNRYTIQTDKPNTHTRETESNLHRLTIDFDTDIIYIKWA